MVEVESFTDWLGQEVRVGDYVTYPVARGRSINVALATVDKIAKDEEYPNEIRYVFVTPLENTGSRWSHGTGKSRYIDNRTGKGIDPWAGAGKHMARSSCHRNVHTGEIFEYAEYLEIFKSNRAASWSDYEYVPAVFKDYVEEVEIGPKSRKLTVVENITKVAREVVEIGGKD